MTQFYQLLSGDAPSSTSFRNHGWGCGLHGASRSVFNLPATNWAGITKCAHGRAGIATHLVLAAGLCSVNAEPLGELSSSIFSPHAGPGSLVVPWSVGSRPPQLLLN